MGIRAVGSEVAVGRYGGTSPVDVRFDASGLSDAERCALSCVWDCDGARASHSWFAVLAPLQFISCNLAGAVYDRS